MSNIVLSEKGKKYLKEIKTMGGGKKKLYDYMFHYNYHTGYWATFKRSDKDKYFNSGGDRSKQDGILFAKDVNILIDFISK